MWTGHWNLSYTFIDANNAPSVAMLALWMMATISALLMHSKIGTNPDTVPVTSTTDEPKHVLVPKTSDHCSNAKIIERHFYLLKDNIFHINIITALVGSVSAACIVATTEGSVGPLTKWFLRYGQNSKSKIHIRYIFRWDAKNLAILHVVCGSSSVLGYISIQILRWDFGK